MRATPDAIASGYVGKVADAFLAVQLGDAGHFPFGVFLSWQKVWHGWGNSQAHALLLTADILQDSRFQRAAKLEIEYFYPYLAGDNYPREFAFQDSENLHKAEKRLFEQIAYNIRPMVLATLTLYRQTGETKYAQAAARYASWFFGNNIAQTQMYDPKTGRCFDGIKSAQTVNRNAGAESTIEALLVILEIERTPAALAALQKYFHENF